MKEKVKYQPMDQTQKQLRLLSWLYIILLIVEGALRKWFLPSLSDVLLLIRDPIVLLAYVIALRNRRFPENRYILVGGALLVLCVATTFMFGHENWKVALFGVRTNFLHVPFAFIMGSVLYRKDVLVVGRYWLWGTLLMTVLIVLQFSTPQSSWFNRGIGGIEGAGFSGAMGRFRPPGTFSFITGVVLFYTYSAAFLVSGLMQHKNYSKVLLALSSMAVFIAVPVSISRSLILNVIIVLFVGFATSAFQKGAISRYIRIAVIAAIGLFIASQMSVFDEAKEAFLERWNTSTSDDSGGVQGAIIERTLFEFIGPFISENELPFFGIGLGAGTQAGVQMLTGERGFALGESEWFRLTGESGIFLGACYIAWRVWLALLLARFAYLGFRRGNGIGLLLLSASVYNILVGQLGQTTVQGFTIVGIGLTIASLRPRKTIETKKNDEVAA